jgi:hypothetical protein
MSLDLFVIKLHHRPTGDSIVIEGLSIAHLRKEVKVEMERRGWKEDDCWSESLTT